MTGNWLHFNTGFWCVFSSLCASLVTALFVRATRKGD